MPDNRPDIGSVHVTTPAGTFHGYPEDVITKHLSDFGAHTRNELAMVLDHIGETDLCVDFGAHIGTYSIPIARKLKAPGRILAVEGGPETFALLQRNVAENGLAATIETVCAIVGEGEGQPVRRVEVEGHSGASHYLADEEASLVVQDAGALLQARGFDSPDFVKIDVEGMEFLVLKSLAPIIAACRPKLYIEMNKGTFAHFDTTYDDIEGFLRAYGYRLCRNVGSRNSGSDAYEMRELKRLEDGGHFYDLLALPG